MDENQIGPNMHTTPMQRYVRDGPYPSGKSVPCNLKVLGSNPSGVEVHREASNGQKAARRSSRGRKEKSASDKR